MEMNRIERAETLRYWRSIKEVREIHDELCDFFNQFEITDSWVCDIITWALGIWMLGVTTFRYAYLNSDQPIPLNVNIGQAVVLIVYSTQGIILWGIRRRLLRAYSKVWSIAAYCPPEECLRLVRLSEKFVKRNSYTFLFGHSFVPLSYLTCIGWTISCVFVVDSLFKRCQVVR